MNEQLIVTKESIVIKQQIVLKSLSWEKWQVGWHSLNPDLHVQLRGLSPNWFWDFFSREIDIFDFTSFFGLDFF